MYFPEDFLHYIWKFRLFQPAALITECGKTLEISDTGFQNKDAGPDFQNARIRIGETLWAGNVEVHIQSSDWQRHQHATDDAYNNVILHVVYEDDRPVKRRNGDIIPTLVLKDRIASDLYSRYENLLKSYLSTIPCEHMIAKVAGITWQNWLTRVLIERLERRSEEVEISLVLNKGDWEATFYQFLAANFGFKTNALPFELLAKSLPQLILAKHKNNALQINALIFGQAGFLNERFTEDYPLKLQTEYIFLKKKYGLNSIDQYIWKFLRLRPLNFPTVRLAQFAALVLDSNHLFSKILAVDQPEQLREHFQEVIVNTYWDNHYHFGKTANRASKKIGRHSIDNILINTVSLFLFAYGKITQTDRFIDRSLALLENIPAETNSIVKIFTDFGIEIENSYESQAVIELKKTYCDHKRCLSCGIGNSILKTV
ncbi:MAG: DUF2851 family protein [Sphingobacteriaceae bacterium]